MNTKKSGFTLVELLTVIVLIGIILAIAFPAVNQLVYNQDREELEYHKKLVEEATDLYIDQYVENFDPGADCYNIPYNALIEEELLKEDRISCYDENLPEGTVGGVIQITKTSSNNGFTYKYFLNCENVNTKREISKAENIPNGCLGVNGDFYIYEDRVVIEEIDNDGNVVEAYDHNWTPHSVRQTLQATDPYMVGLRGFKYSLDNGYSWTYNDGNNFTVNKSVNTNIRIKAVDNDGNESSEITYVLKIDKTAPVINSVAGNPTYWTHDDVTLTVNATDWGIGLHATAYSFDDGATWQTSNQKTYTANQTVKIKTRDAVGNISKATTIVIDKIDKTVPGGVKITNPTNGNPTNQDFALTLATSTIGISGVDYYQYSYNNSTWTTWSNSTDKSPFTTPNFTAERKQDVYIRVCSKAGLCSTGVTTFIWIDKTPPVITYNKAGGLLKGHQSVTITVTDDTCYDRMDVQTDLDGSKVAAKSANGITTSTHSVAFDVDGAWVLYVKAYDKAGNKNTADPINSYGWYYQNYTVVSYVTKWRYKNYNSKTCQDCGYTNYSCCGAAERSCSQWSRTVDGFSESQPINGWICDLPGTVWPDDVKDYKHCCSYGSYYCSCCTGANSNDCQPTGGQCCGHYWACGAEYECGSWGGWSSWSTTSCTASSTKQCQSAECLVTSADGACDT